MGSASQNYLILIADVHSKSPANLGLPSIVQDCTDSVPPLADADMSIISRYMYSDCSLAGIQCIYKHMFCIVHKASVSPRLSCLCN